MLAATILSACAPKEVLPPEQLVVKRSNAKWDAIFAKDFETAYSYLSAGFREIYTEQAYESRIKRQPVKWKAAKAVSAECDSDVCKVSVELDYKFKPRTRMSKEVDLNSVIFEKWVLGEDGQWYYVPKR